ncbi:MAG: hypothetical protein GF353_03710 [Candidatus Lokiarchaeota archaeon]|nr:hypothetical protein [Candidatus Lokiarchaeota archaeon]
MGAKEILSTIEQFESSFDTYRQLIEKNNNEIVQNMSIAWKNMKSEQEVNEKLKATISEQNSELTGLRTESESLENTINELKAKKQDLNSKITELTSTLEKTMGDLKKPQFELETLKSNLQEINTKIEAKESEKTTLDQKKVGNENDLDKLKAEHVKRMEEVEAKIDELSKENFFTNFIIENSDEDIHEVDILAAIMEKGKCQLDEIKRQLDITPIMAVRTIKQLAVKEIINLNEQTNEITMD